MGMTQLDRTLQAHALLARRAEGDRLMLSDAVLIGALGGSRPLTHGERAALHDSPLTLRRLRHLAAQHRTDMRRTTWTASCGMLRAADSGAALDMLRTDDRMWRLHFVRHGNDVDVIVQIDLDAPGAADLLATRATIAVRDGAGALIVQGALDNDGECEGRWPFALPPAAHFQQHGARFEVALGTLPATPPATPPAAPPDSTV